MQASNRGAGEVGNVVLVTSFSSKNGVMQAIVDIKPYDNKKIVFLFSGLKVRCTKRVSFRQSWFAGVSIWDVKHVMTSRTIWAEKRLECVF